MSSISEHEPHSDMVGRGPYVSPTGGVGEGGGDGMRLDGGGTRERVRGRVVRWLEGVRVGDEGEVGRRGVKKPGKGAH